jgi:hypothetical protein
MATAKVTAKAKAPAGTATVNTATPQHSTFLALGVELLGVGFFTLLAGISDDAGKVMVTLMAGFWLIYLVTNGPLISKLGNGLSAISDQAS